MIKDQGKTIVYLRLEKIANVNLLDGERKND